MGLACRKRHLAPWLEPFWWCNCNYHNVATYRVLLLRLTAAEEPAGAGPQCGDLLVVGPREHARKKHNVQGMTDTIYNYIRDKANQA